MRIADQASLCVIALAVWPMHGWGQALPHVSPYRIETVAGSPRNGDGGPASAAQISGIQGIAIDRPGNLYLSDTDNHRVRRVTPGGVISTVAGTGLAGYSGDAGPAVQAQLNLPYGLAVDAAGNLYIADLGNNRVRRVSMDGIITTVATGSPLATPRNVAVDAAGNLYVAEFDGHRVRRVSTNGTVANVAGTGKAGFSGDGGPPDQAQLAYPAGVAIDRGGALLIADSQNNRVRRIFANGTIGTVLGGSMGTALYAPVAVAADAAGTIYAGDSTPVVRALSIEGKWSDVATLGPVRDLAVDGNGNLYVAEGPRVRRVNPGGAVTTVAGDGYQHAIGDGGPAQDALLSRPSSVALDGAGFLAIADTGTQRVRQVANGAIATLAGGLSGPMGVAADLAGTVYFADTGSDAIRAVGSDRRVRTVTTAVRGPRGVCLSRGGTLYAADTGNGRVIRLGAGVEMVAGQLNAPEACALDSFGNLYIAETGSHRVRKRSALGELTTVAGTGEAGSQGDEGPAKAARLVFPRGVAVDDNGNVYIADTGGNRIRLVTPDGMIHTIAGTGQAGFAGDGGAAAGARLNGPAGLLIDGAGVVYFADSGNDRVRRLVPDAAFAVLPPAVVVTNALSGAAGPVAPGEIVRITGEGIEPGVELWFDGVAVAFWSAGPGQIAAQVPDAVKGASTHVEVRVNGKVVGAGDVVVVEAAPGLLGVAINEDGWLNAEMRPVMRGGLVTLVATGEGRSALPVRVSVTGNPAEVVEMAGVAGILVVVARMPTGFVGAGEAAVVLTVGTARSNAIGVWLK